MFELVIFDLDGLLVDSEPFQYRAFNQVFTEHGHPLTFDQFLCWRDWQLIARWAEFHDLAVDPVLVREKKHQVYCELIHTDVDLKPGARALVELVSRISRAGIASGSRMDTIERCIEKFGLKEHFEVMVSTTSVSRGKPYPDVFLETASRLSVSPDRVVVIENAANGFRAARAAGMACIVCPDSSAPDPEHDYEGVDLIVESLHAVDRDQLLQLYDDTEKRNQGIKNSRSGSRKT